MKWIWFFLEIIPVFRRKVEVVENRHLYRLNMQFVRCEDRVVRLTFPLLGVLLKLLLVVISVSFLGLIS